MCASYTDNNFHLSDAYKGYPAPSSQLRGREMKFSEMIPPSFLLSRIQQTSKRPKPKPCPPGPAVKMKSCKFKRNVGVNTCQSGELQYQHCAIDCANSCCNMMPEYSTLYSPTTACMNPVGSVRAAGLPSKRYPQFDPCTGQEICSTRPNRGDNFVSYCTQEMPSMNSAFYPTAQYYPMAPEVHNSAPPPTQQYMNATRTLPNAKPSSATSIGNPNAKSASSKRSVNSCASKVSFKLQNPQPQNRCPQKLMKPKKRPTLGVSCLREVKNRDRDRNRAKSCCQIRVKDKTDSPAVPYTVGKYGVKKPNYCGLNKDKYPRHDCLSKDKKKAQTSCVDNIPVSSKEKSCICKSCMQPTNSKTEFTHCAAPKQNLLERICNSLQIPSPPENCYILLPLNTTTKSKRKTRMACPQTQCPVTCQDDDNKSTCSDKSATPKSSKLMRTCGCNTDNCVNDRVTADKESSCTSGSAIGPGRTFYFNPYTGYYYPWYMASCYHSGCQNGFCPPSCPIPSTKTPL